MADAHGSGYDRRSFLRLGGGAIALGALASGAGGLVGSWPAAAATANDDFVEDSLDELQQAMAKGRVSSRELTRWYLERIDRLNPLLGAVIETNPDALAIAADRDRERRGGSRCVDRCTACPSSSRTTSPRPTGCRRPRARWPSSAAAWRPTPPSWRGSARRARSSWARRTCRSGRTSAASARSTAGAHAVGSPATRTSSSFDPCGSSSGSAVSAAASLCAAAVGTETDGSITYPAGLNSLVGLKPTVGLVAQQGIIPIAFSQDTAGPMARTADGRRHPARRPAVALPRRRPHAAGRPARRLPVLPAAGRAARRPDRRRPAALRLRRPGLPDRAGRSVRPDRGAGRARVRRCGRHRRRCQHGRPSACSTPSCRSCSRSSRSASAATCRPSAGPKMRQPGRPHPVQHRSTATRSWCTSARSSSRWPRPRAAWTTRPTSRPGRPASRSRGSRASIGPSASTGSTPSSARPSASPRRPRPWPATPTSRSQGASTPTACRSARPLFAAALGRGQAARLRVRAGAGGGLPPPTAPAGPGRHRRLRRSTAARPAAVPPHGRRRGSGRRRGAAVRPGSARPGR